jgi:hypothetical protein
MTGESLRLFRDRWPTCADELCVVTAPWRVSMFSHGSLTVSDAE